MIKAVNVVMSDVGTGKSVTFNVEVDSVLQVDPDSVPKSFTVTVGSETQVEASVQSVLSDYLSSVSAPTNPTDLADIEL